MLEIDQEVETKIAIGTSSVSVSYTVYNEADISFTSGSMGEIGSTGIYTCSWTPDAAGIWTVHITCVSPAVDTAFIYHVSIGVEYSAAKTTGSHDITAANDLTETQVFETTRTGINDISIRVDLDAVETAGSGGTVYLRVYEKIDGSNYSDKPVAVASYIVGVSSAYPSLTGVYVSGIIKLTIQCASNVAGTLAVPWSYVIKGVGD